MCAKSIWPQCCVRSELAILAKEKKKEKTTHNFPLCKSLYLLHALPPPPGIPFPLPLPRRSHIHTHSQAQSSDVSCRTPIKSSFPVSQDSLAIYLLFYSFLFCFLLFFAVCLPGCHAHNASFICVVVSECANVPQLLLFILSYSCASPHYSYVIFNAVTPQTAPLSYSLYSSLSHISPLPSPPRMLAAVAVIKADFFIYYKKTAFTVVSRLCAPAACIFSFILYFIFFLILCTSLSSARIAL